MNWKQRLSHIHLMYLSKPAGDRCLYRAIRTHGVRSIVQIGIGAGQRTHRLIDAVGLYSGDRPLRYTGIDLFEARPSHAPGLTLKQAHQQFRPLVHKLQLVPGDPYSALNRTANSLQGTDLVVVAADVDAESLQRSWFFLPRMLHAKSLVLVEQQVSGGTKGEFQSLPLAELERRAQRAAPQRAA
jgi:hypothetical protein